MLQRSVLILLFATVACQAKQDTPVPDSTQNAVAPAPRRLPSIDGTFDMEIPVRWTGLYRVDSLSSIERGTARAGALNIVYLPRDTTLLPQTLVVVAVYDSAAWAAVRVAGGPPPGDSVLAQAGRVYVLALPQSNPFAPGTVDAFKFDSLALNPLEQSTLVRVR